MYEIEARLPPPTGWIVVHRKERGDYAFETEAEAEAAIVTVRAQGGDWSLADYRVVPAEKHRV